MLLRTIIRLIRGMGQPKERLSNRDGFLSYSAEVHAFVHGWFAGMFHKSPRPPSELPNIPDIQKEPHYYKGGYIFGTLLQWLAIVLALYNGGIEFGYL